MPVHTQRDADAALGAAWRRAEAALPAFALLRLTEVPGWPYFKQPPFEAQIEWWEGNDRRIESRFGDSPTLALEALSEALEARHAD